MPPEFPSWVIKMDNLFQAKTPFLALVSFDRDHGEVYTMDQCIERNILFNFKKKTNHDVVAQSNFENQPIEFVSIDKKSYARGFDHVMKEIRHGNTYLLNYCSASFATSEVDMRSIYYQSKAPYRLLYEDRFVVFSPECFIKLSGDELVTFPMKGTIDAQIPNAENILLSDEKELAEHHTIVDLLRNDIGAVCDFVEVSRFAYLDKIQTSKGPVLQMSSEIRGIVSGGLLNSPGQMFYALLPAGSISGAPKKQTLDIISEVENFTRGFYTGVMIYFDGNEFDSGVMIRFIEKDEEGRYWYKSGGGITHQSELNKEYDELIRKIYLPFY